jgi:NAD(P)-dependent dehydrogenase (short-subunit alcohol dehydrogenase family)
MPESPEAAGRLLGRVAVVTGASRGLGRAVAARFAAEGAHCVLLARTVGALEELDDEIRKAGGTRPTLVPMDLLDAAKIDQLGAALHDRFGRLDVLAGCAGALGSLSPLGHIGPKVWEETLSLNLGANYRLLRSLDPLLRRSGSGRAVFATCQVGRGSAYWALQSASKAALEAMVLSYAQEVAKFAVTANLVSPGPLRTGLRATAFPGEDPETVPLPESVTDCFVELASPDDDRNGQIVSP